jgi:hypothetical protein
LSEHRRGAVSRDTNHERRAVDDGAEGKIAEGRPVDHVHRHAGRARRDGKARGFVVIVAFGNRDRRAGEIVRAPSALMNGYVADRRRGRKRAHVLAGLRTENVDCRAGRRKQFGLPGGGLSAAGDDGALSRERKERWQPR